MNQTRVVGFQVQIGNDFEGWVAFGARRNRVSTANVVADRARKIYVNADSIETRVVRITETREVIA